jgi:hypothetical protein
MSQLLACPFCRELFERTEAEHCPECDIPLEPLHRLPASPEAALEQAVRWERTRPEDIPLPWRDLRRGRGLLLALALASLVVFALAPWVTLSAPHAEQRTGLSLARGPLGFLWGGALAWFVAFTLVLSRRTIAEMRGVRAVLMAFAAMTLSEVAVLLVMSPQGSRHVQVVYAWAWGLYAALGLSLAGVLVAARFGGPRPPPETQPPEAGAASERPRLVH